jgi:enoyl-[acyl-carrier protein] reductase III
MKRRLALITGGTRGIGLGIAYALAKREIDLVLSYLRNEARAEDSRQKLQNLGISVSLVQADSGSRADTTRLFDFIRQNWGFLDIVVSNGSSGVLKPILELTEGHLRWTLDSNVKALLIQSQLAFPLMRGRQGNIIAITSIGAGRAVRSYSAVGVAKAAMASLVRHLADEFGSHGINVNAVCPGLVDTEALTSLPRQKAIKGWVRARTPMGRLTTVDDVGGVVSFLCSEESQMIQGQTLVVDGGYSIRA